MKELSDKSKPKSLEELFRARMEAAEETPSDRVWERIEQGLDLHVAGYYKERVSWYKSLAAACIALVVCAALYMYYDVNTRHNGADRGLFTLPQAQESPALANNKPAHAPAKSPAENKMTGNNLAGESTAAAEEILPAQNSLANTKSAGRNKVLNKDAESPNSRIGTNNDLNNTYAAGKSGDKTLIRSQAGLNNITAAQDKYPAETGIIALNKQGTAVVIAGEEVGAVDLEPLVSVKPWASLGKMVSADSLWRPRAIEAAPPALALAPVAVLEPAKKPLARWSFSARYAPQYFNQNLELASTAAPQYLTAPANSNFSGAPAAAINTGGYTEALHEFDRNTTSGFSYNTAVAAGYALNEHWSLEAGLLFTQNVANGKSSYVFNNSYLAARYNYASPATSMNDMRSMGQAAALPTTALVASLSGQQNLQYSAVIQTPAFDTQYRYRALGVPVKLNYQTKNRKSFYFASVGLLTNLLVQAQILSESSRVPDIKFGSSPESPFRPWQFATVLSAGKGFRVSKAFSLKAGLEGTQYLTSLAAHPENLNSKQRKPYSIGVAFSSSYTLGR